MVTSFFQARLENEGLLTPGLDEANTREPVHERGVQEFLPLKEAEDRLART
jgi:hypothetical protein